MRVFWMAALLISAAQGAQADLARAENEVLGPAYDDLAKSAAQLDVAAQSDCGIGNLREPYQALWDSWARIGFFQIGPVEEEGRALGIAFWPDPKQSGLRTQQQLVDQESEIIVDPEAFGTISVAARGLPALERLIYPPGVTGDEAVLCELRRATAADLARVTAEIDAEWDGFADTLLSAGAEGNDRFLTPTEAQQAVYTQLMSGLEQLADTRLGRPLGTEDQPRPERAEARAAGRSLRNIVLSLQGMRDLAVAMLSDGTVIEAAFNAVIAEAETLDDPVLDGVAEPEGRARILSLQTAIRDLRETAETEIGAALGLGVGFNSRDGD
ncbi:imelysin family protein [Paracoccus sediminicola]|uniref:imelysin family protein n=1 Tax=Paracoccus sediminicola TaxID=3017783 RepID=UPI0022F02D50|nr:imelysin family protein [Paracoccus sediminicola]WBU55496.1 imelysin family protein [Paracoccus sediminicola]